jgi:uncharacterized membrane protein YecN with MAPEG domain
MVIITSFYAGIIGLLYLGLSLDVIRNRFRFRQSMGTGEEAKLEKVVRVHGNFAEYVPIILTMLGFLELGGANKNTLHFFGITLIIGRILHALGLSYLKAPNSFRTLGMMGTFTCLIGASIRLIFLALDKGF